MLSNRIYPSVERVMKVTAFKDEKTAEAAIAALKWFDEGAPHKYNGCPEKIYFDMNAYVKPKKDHNLESCGTVCCIAGAIQLHKLDGRSPGYQMGARDLAMHFQFNPEDRSNPLTQLFYPMDTKVSHAGISSKTPKQAAETLRNYLFTGTVDWNLL